MADLLPRVLDTHGEEDSHILRLFADFHSARNKEQVLQRIDPDLAAAIRRVWNVPPATDRLAKRGRKKGR
jgi:hypothetical protein